jgi:multiple sugar transport system substrate-binding protein
MKHRITRVVALSSAAALLLAGCTPASDSSAEDPTTVTFRLWDPTVAAAYEDSFDRFEEEHPDIDVQVNLVEWSDYWTSLRTDVAEQTMDDVFWINNSYVGAYADAGSLVDVDLALGEDAKDAWEPTVVDQFTRDDTLWGVPQLYDAGVAVYYNAALLDAAGISPEDIGDLTWSPDPEEDTFTQAARSLTRDTSGRAAGTEGFDAANIAKYGTNLAYDLQAILLPYIGSNGGHFQDGDDFAFAEDAAAEAISYVVSKVRSDHVAPDPAATNANGDFSRDAFIQGKMALFQSGIYNLKNINEGAAFEWGVAMIPSGPKGRVSVTNGVVAAGNAASEKQDEIATVLEWLGSEEGAAPLGESGAAVPGVTAAQDGFFDYWKGEDVDVDPFFEVVDGNTTIPTPTGADFGKAFAQYDPIFRDIFLGAVDPDDGLRRAQDAANAAVAD